MKIEPLTKDRYKEWDDFCLKSDDVWFWHTTGWLEYTLNYKPERRSKSMSFMITNNSRIEGICPLFVETGRFGEEEIKEFSFGESPGPMPALKNGLSEKIRDKRFKMIFEHVDELALKNNVLRASFRASPLAPRFLNSNTPPNNYLMKYGYVPISLNTQIMNLSKSLEALRSDVRHGHAYDIKRGLKHLQVVAFDKNNVHKEIYKKYEELHHKAAGRVTRPQITFDMMYDWILQGYAVLFAAKMNNEFVGFSYVYTYKNAAYYGSACNHPDYPEMPIGHVLQWKTIQWLKEHGFKYFEIGYQHYHRLSYNFASQKEIDISTFKRGFGGFPVPLFMGEKYYSKDYYLQVNLERVRRYAKWHAQEKTVARGKL